MRARFDGICIKCGGRIIGWQTSPNEECSDIGWRRRGETYGLDSVAWHTNCSYRSDNMEVIRQLREKKTSKPVITPIAPIEHKPVMIDSNPVNPVTNPVTISFNQVMEESKHMNQTPNDFLAGMANALVPYLEGKLSANLSDVHAQVKETLEGLESQLQSMIDKASRKVTLEIKENDNVVTLDAGEQHYKFEVLAKLAHKRKNVYLYGAPGSGKTSAAMEIAKLLKLDFGYISLTVQTSESRIVGYMSATGDYIPTEFYKRYTEGGVFLIDEIDNASGNLLTALNSALANGHGAFPIGNVQRHPDFICIVTGNTTGFGHNPMFPERQVLSGAIRDRFLFVDWGYDNEFERKLAMNAAADSDKASLWINWVQSVRDYAKQYDPKLPVTPRASIEGASLLDTFDYSDVAHMTVFRGYDADSVARILKAHPLPR